MQTHQLNVAGRLAISGFCLSVLLGVGYALMAISTSTTGGAELIPSFQAVQQHYAGSRLISAMEGSMYDYVSYDESIESVRRWIDSGAPEAIYRTDIAPIMSEDCTKCHSAGSTMTDAMPSLPLTDYQSVLAVTERGKPWAQIAVQSHTHLFAISVVALLLGLLTAHSRVRVGLQILLIGAAFIGLWGDALAWSLAKSVPWFGYTVPLTGAILVGALMAMALLVGLDCWFRLPLLTRAAGPGKR